MDNSLLRSVKKMTLFPKYQDVHLSTMSESISLLQRYKLFTLYDKTNIWDKTNTCLFGNLINFPNENYNCQPKIKDLGQKCPGLFNSHVSSIVYGIISHVFIYYILSLNFNSFSITDYL